MDIPSNLRHTEDFKVKQMIQNGQRKLPDKLKITNSEMANRIMEVEIHDEAMNLIIWKESSDCSLTMKKVYSMLA